MKFYTVREALALLPVNISERAFRRKLREIGAARANGRQLFLTEADFAAYLESIRSGGNKWASNSSSAAPRGTGTRTARSMGNGSAEALKLIHEKMRAGLPTNGRKRLLTGSR